MKFVVCKLAGKVVKQKLFVAEQLFRDEKAQLSKSILFHES